MAPLCSWLNQALLSDLPPRRRRSYLCFAGALLVALGSHQFAVPVKTSVFLDSVGTQAEPIAKTCVTVVLLPILFLYSALVTVITDPKVFVFLICGIYAVLFAVVAVGLAAAGGHSRTWPAWLLYYATETKAVIVMPMIWSVVADTTTPEIAAKAYPPIFFAVQVGGVLGSVAALKVSSLGGEIGLLLLQAGCFLLIAALTWCACSLVGDSAGELRPLAGAAAAALEDAEGGGAGSGGGEDGCPRLSPKTAAAPLPRTWLEVLRGGGDGLWLLLSRPYVFGTFWVSYAYLVPRTLMDYQNSVLVVNSFPSRQDQIAFLGQVSLMMNIGTALLTLVGTRPLVEWLGLSGCLLALPLATFACIFALCTSYSLNVSVWSLAKAWSEMYGNQLMKLFGAQINLWVNLESSVCKPHCFHQGPTAALSGVWIVLWAGVAMQVGREHSRLELEQKHIS